MLQPPLHHGAAAFEIIGAVVGRADLVGIDVGEGGFDEVGINSKA